MENPSLWFLVLTYFDRRSYFSNGLTIPFLLGANSIIRPQEKTLTVRDFFSEIIDESLPRKISLQKCDYIGEYVIGIFDSESIAYSYSGKSLYQQFGNLYITDNSVSYVKESSDLESILANIYQPILDSNFFSIDSREWGDYSQKDKSQLEELKNILEKKLP